MSGHSHAAHALLFVLLAIAASGCTLWKERPVRAWQQATGGEHLERLFWKEIKDRNWAELEKHLAPTFVMTMPAGRRDRAAAIEHLKSFELADYVLGDFDIQPSGADLVVTYVVTIHGLQGGRPLTSGPVRMMTVWQHGKRGWMAVAQSFVPAPSQEGAAQLPVVSFPKCYEK